MQPRLKRVPVNSGRFGLVVEWMWGCKLREDLCGPYGEGTNPLAAWRNWRAAMERLHPHSLAWRQARFGALPAAR